MPKDLAVSQLLDVYGQLLGEKQRLLCELYFDEDLSLSEISENEGITRQGVRDAIMRAQQQLHTFEEKLGIIEKTDALRREAEMVRSGKENSRLLEMIEQF